MSEELVRAAGGVVVSRPAGRDVRVVIVHRPEYDDWSLPKGKCEAGEAWEACALREVEEETSLQCQLLGSLGSTEYRDRRGRPKEVRYWLMRPESGALQARLEVDDARWATPAEAIAKLTYEHDRELVARVAQETRLWVVRHADAGDRAEWQEPDHLRPLSAKGRRQAEGIAAMLRGENLSRVASSPYIRCVQTLEPLGLPIDRVLELGEGHGLEGIEPLLVAGGSVVACTHGDVIDELLDELRYEGLAGADAKASKGSTWKLRARAGLIEAAEYIPPPK